MLDGMNDEFYGLPHTMNVVFGGAFPLPYMKHRSVICELQAFEVVE